MSLSDGGAPEGALRPRPRVVDGTHAVHVGARHPVRLALRPARLRPLPVRVVAPARRPASFASAASAGRSTASRPVIRRCVPRSRGTSACRVPCGRRPTTSSSPTASSRRSTSIARVLLDPGRPRRRRGPRLPAAPSAAARRWAWTSSAVPVDDEGIVVDAIPTGVRARARHTVAPVPARAHDVVAPAGGPAALGGAGGRGDRRGRLRQRVPLRRPADRAAAAPRRAAVACSTPARSPRRCCRRCGSASSSCRRRCGRRCGPPSTSPTGRRRRRSNSPSPSSSTAAGSPATCGRCASLYRERHELISATLAATWPSVLKEIPSDAGLHLSAVVARDDRRGCRAGHTRRRLDDGVVAYSLASFGDLEPRPAGVVLGYGAVQLADIPEALRRSAPLRRVISIRPCRRGMRPHPIAGLRRRVSWRSRIGGRHSFRPSTSGRPRTGPAARA